MQETTTSAAPESAQPSRFSCEQCGAKLEYAPGTEVLRCAYCGHENRIATASGAIVEADFRAALLNLAAAESVREDITRRCESCGARYTLGPDVHAGECPFCGAPAVAATTNHRHIPATALLPFKIPREQARAAFRAWLRSLWFAPNKLKDYGRGDSKLNGLYVPYWTYDAATASTYTGARGDYYQVRETYTTVEDGKTVTRTRMVTKIRWTPASGRVARNFDDVLVLASESLPRRVTERLEPWDLENLVAYTPDYLSGFQSEMYQIELARGFDYAREIMAGVIRQDIARDIGGDQQRIDHVDTRYGDIRFKHILLPAWVSAFRFKDKVYRFVVNARTGEVQGERPYSPWKIAFAVIVAVILAGVAFTVLRTVQGG